MLFSQLFFLSQASFSMEDKTTILLLLTELACHGLAQPDFFTFLQTKSFKARSSLLKVNSIIPFLFALAFLA